MDDLTAFTEPEFLATQEHLARYRADGRGYLAVGLGDVLGDKVEDGNGKERGGSGYVLRHKLGFGGFGVVWLGWDLGLVLRNLFCCFLLRFLSLSISLALGYWACWIGARRSKKWIKLSKTREEEIM